MKKPNLNITKLLIQPGAGSTAIVEAIEQAREIIHIVIFRFDRGEIEAALKRAVKRGVFVHALVAHTSVGQGGESTLRNLEMRLLADGVSVARTAIDLVRYHDKLMIIDRTTLFVLAFNYTYIDTERSRSFGIVTTDPIWVREAERLFIADTMRQPYTSECESIIVSPGNARARLTALMTAARRQILIYDDKLSDPDMMRLLAAKVRQGVEVRVIGSVGKRAYGVQTVDLTMRLHAQVIVCDGERMFLGSQSLRTVELDARREVGVLIDDPDIIRQVVATFEADWSRSWNVAEARRNSTLLTGSELATDRAAIDVDDAALDEGMAASCLSPAIAAQLVKLAVKDAIKDVLIETLPQAAQVIPLKEVVKDAVKNATKEALHELAV